MGMASQRIPTKGWQKNSDDIELRTRVATYVDGTSMSYENTDFAIGSSPLVIDFFTDTSGKSGHKGWFVNDGPGDIQLEFSADGTAYGGVHTIRANERISLDDLAIKKIRLTWVSDTGYRAAIF